MFDVSNRDTIKHEWTVDLPIEGKDWSIGLIVGPSGSGKTTIGRQLFPDAHFHEQYDWPQEKAIVDGFPSDLEGKVITQALSSVGFSSPPHWLKRFDHLSNGQKFRCELARLMLENADTVVVDEFTSIVDRDAAKISCAAVAKSLRQRKRPRLVALSCHYDIVDWLQPDWVYDVATEEFSWRSLWRRPDITLEIRKADKRAWLLFRGHHYLSRDIHVGSSMFVATWNENPVGFASYLPSMGFAGVKREHRTVVLPDFQGVGIGNALSEWLGAYCKSKGWRFRSVSSHPAMIRHRAKSPLWKMELVGRLSSHSNWSINKTSSRSRNSGSFEYIGPHLTAGD